jgi:hypothetical protein
MCKRLHAKINEEDETGDIGDIEEKDEIDGIL